MKTAGRILRTTIVIAWTWSAALASAAPTTTTPFVDDELAGFSTREANQRAMRVIDRAGAVFDRLRTGVAGHLKSAAAGRADCPSRTLDRAVDSLRPIDDDARAYLDQAWWPEGDPGDREAAMDVFEELNAEILGGWLSIIRAYRVAGCLVRAQQLIQEAHHLYAGPVYASWLKDFDAEQTALDRALAAAAPRKPAASATPATPVTRPGASAPGKGVLARLP